MSSSLKIAALSAVLTEAKKAHTFWEQAFTKQGATVPEHKWEDWYARFLERRMDGDTWADAASFASKGFQEPDYQSALTSVLLGEWGRPGPNGWSD